MFSWEREEEEGGAENRRKVAGFEESTGDAE